MAQHDCVCEGQCLIQQNKTVVELQNSIKEGKKNYENLQKMHMTSLQAMSVIAKTLADIESECDLPLKCTNLVKMLVLF